MKIINICFTFCYSLSTVMCWKKNLIFGKSLRKNTTEAKNIIDLMCLISLSKRKQNSVIKQTEKCKADNYQPKTFKSFFTDPDIKQQWYFFEKTKIKKLPTHELYKIWAHGITGKGINVAIIGGGLEVDHKDLKDNLNRYLSFNFVNHNPNIYPSQYGHSTESAGLISAVGNNSECGVGAAPSSKISVLQIFDDSNNKFDDILFSRALVYMNNLIQIYLINFSLKYPIKLDMSAGSYVKKSLETGIMFGRQGLGSIFITGSGDLNINDHNNCGSNKFLQRVEVLVIAAYFSSHANHKYIERCVAILASAVSTLDKDKHGELFTTTSNNKCSNATSGSFAAASITAGIIALLLSKNPTLNLRQIVHLIIHTSRQYDSNAVLNKAGYLYSYYYGFGLINAELLLIKSNSDTIKNIPPEHLCSTYTFYGKRRITKRLKYILLIYTSGCLDYTYCVTRLEYVFMVFSLNIQKRMNVRIFLTSPSGTRLKVLQPTFFEKPKDMFSDWRIKIMGYFGEGVNGVWKLEISTRDNVAIFNKLELIFHGTCANPKTNVESHMRVLNFLNENLKVNTSKEFMKRLTSSESTHAAKLRLDITSFTSIQFPQIITLINLR